MAHSYPQIVLLGDSLLQQSVDIRDGFSFQAALQTRFIRRLDVVNRGFSGWNSANAVEYLSEMIPQQTSSSPKLKYLIVLLGANDAVLPLPSTSQHVPIEQYKQNLIKIITHAHIRAHNPEILLVTPPPVDEIKRTKLDIAEGHGRAVRLFARSASYSETVREVAREHPGTVLIDLWKAIMERAIEMTPHDYTTGGPWLGSPENGKQGGLDNLLPDGLHMSGEAYKVFYDEIIGHVGREWASLPEEDRTGYMFPDWRVLNPIES
ncbi:uncharacterized protein UV8b_02865 [Ustilaginoidea virens]|uniref:SGNH hydrolase-type esterase domain-containing protein n=1 Tax=Ustilaginoidea virens TaxID=1159556 RepID=A0A8E5HNJ4_USTVR|nr:uncharacterized protein UV8b_02865 [Ustilaginoidea virens]QUC18624.1 hypothetical protein UV8b_02865 [Ustilaginoidea virens]